MPASDSEPQRQVVYEPCVRPSAGCSGGSDCQPASASSHRLLARDSALSTPVVASVPKLAAVTAVAVCHLGCIRSLAASAAAAPAAAACETLVAVRLWLPGLQSPLPPPAESPPTPPSARPATSSGGSVPVADSPGGREPGGGVLQWLPSCWRAAASCCSVPLLLLLLHCLLLLSGIGGQPALLQADWLQFLKFFEGLPEKSAFWREFNQPLKSAAAARRRVLLAPRPVEAGAPAGAHPGAADLLSGTPPRAPPAPSPRPPAAAPAPPASPAPTPSAAARRLSCAASSPRRYWRCCQSEPPCCSASSPGCCCCCACCFCCCCVAALVGCFALCCAVWLLGWLLALLVWPLRCMSSQTSRTLGCALSAHRKRPSASSRTNSSEPNTAGVRVGSGGETPSQTVLLPASEASSLPVRAAASAALLTICRLTARGAPQHAAKCLQLQPTASPGTALLLSFTGTALLSVHLDSLLQLKLGTALLSASPGIACSQLHWHVLCSQLHWHSALSSQLHLLMRPVAPAVWPCGRQKPPGVGVAQRLGLSSRRQVGVGGVSPAAAPESPSQRPAQK
uniref:Protein kinase domain-containing protein n=1 Tax=Macrostomum lignano TaxID=282301 RepID=A0A1I8FEF4_9PLAT